MSLILVLSDWSIMENYWTMEIVISMMNLVSLGGIREILLIFLVAKNTYYRVKIRMLILLLKNSKYSKIFPLKNLCV